MHRYRALQPLPIYLFNISIYIIVFKGCYQFLFSCKVVKLYKYYV